MPETIAVASEMTFAMTPLMTLYMSVPHSTSLMTVHKCMMSQEYRESFLNGGRIWDT